MIAIVVVLVVIIILIVSHKGRVPSSDDNSSQSSNKNKKETINKKSKEIPVAHAENQDGVEADFINATFTKSGDLDLIPPTINFEYKISPSLPVVKDKKNKNAMTGHPVGAKLEIQAAKNQLESAKEITAEMHNNLKDSQYGINDQYLDNRDFNKRIKAKILALSAIPDAKANLYFLEGKWADAEKEWLSVLYTTHKISDKLSKLYKREHRYEDASVIIHLGNFSSDTGIGLMRDSTFKKRIERYKKLDDYAMQHTDKDKSKLPKFGILLTEINNKKSQNGL